MPILAPLPPAPTAQMTAADKADLLARIVKAQSVGATILSNMTQAKKLAELIPTEES